MFIGILIAEKDEEFEPWYVWVMNRLDVSVTIKK